MRHRIAFGLMLLVYFTGAVSAELSQSASKEILLYAQQLSDGAWTATKQGHGLIEVKQAGLAFGSLRGYDATEVTAKVGSIRGELIKGLERNELRGLQAYVREFFPRNTAQTLPVPRTLDTTCSVTPCPERLAEPGSVQALYGSVHEFVDKVAAATAYRVSFRVRSKPSGARFSLQPLGGGFLTEIATDGRVGSLFRGLYRYTVQREGFKKVEATVNLVDNSPEELYCELVDERAKLGALPCMLGLIE
jgi:hypothetical protein